MKSKIDPTNVAVKMGVPREFWIYLSGPNAHKYIFNEPTYYNSETMKPETIHVVEYSALQAAEERIKELEKELCNLICMRCGDGNHIEALSGKGEK